MKTILKTVFLLCGTGLIPSAVSAQAQVNNHYEKPDSIVMVSTDKANDKLVRIIDETQYRYIHDPQAPRFLLMDKQGKIALGIGGYVRATTEYDFGGIVENTDFITAYIPNSNKVKNQFQMDASTATIFLKLVGHTNKILGDFIVYAAGNYRSGNKVFQLRNAYVTFRNITVGYTYGGFMDLAALPATIDFQGPNGVAAYRATQISYAYTGLKNWRFNASIEMPSVSGTGNDQLSITQQRTPDFTAYIQYGRSENSHLRVGGVVRNMTYTSTLSDKASEVTGYGVQASTSLSFGKRWEFFGQATYGKGIAQYLNDISNLNVDIVPNPEKEGKMQALPMLGWFAGMQYNISPTLFASTTYSMSRLYSENGYFNDQPDSYRYGQYFVANIFWNATLNMQLGAEYLHGWRTDFDKSTHHANRVNLLVQYSF
ncbi:DcaP family trimeric outer membrane transporter [Bacteroides sp. UBA939]|uniref:DcaP family trimeric outer membrane transporter n=1 Tax=Bacteroides sp. UBA939 TaxID=1946092 RepID=UPI0025C557A7|nr:DcaP family trimeric outer membrane transporter [Bacteroides sp. UBA939]